MRSAPQAFATSTVDEGLPRRLRASRALKGSTTTCCTPQRPARSACRAACQCAQGQFGLARRASKIVARVGSNVRTQPPPPVGGFRCSAAPAWPAPPVHAVEITDGQRAGAGDARVVESAKDLHRFVIFDSSLRKWIKRKTPICHGKEYIVTDACPAGGCRLAPEGCRPTGKRTAQCLPPRHPSSGILV